ncbi:maleylpyruvate isomerase [Catenulispora sp. GP43]|uniref:maleylpyruvate isomerase family mycothiol-dependent enzyme n=1 Tax=Catenulispora sp. GP43 TaxID=3156263 RepID=UPI0035129D74
MIEAIRSSSARVIRALSAMDDREARQPSALPGWTRAHVVGHLIQSGDAYLWLMAVARDGVEPWPRAERAAMARELEDLAARPVAELVDGLADRMDRLVRVSEVMPVERWDTLVQALAGWRHPAWYILRRCLRELETHHLDLDVGYRTDDWPAPYVAWALEDTLSTLAARGFPLARVEAVDLERSWALSDAGPVVSGPGHAVLGWLSGRRGGAGLSAQELPAAPAWPMPPTPGWG